MSILVCVITLLCPVICSAQPCGLGAEHEHPHDAPEATHHAGGGCQDSPQSNGDRDPAPHSEHSCLCTGGTPPGAAWQVPALAPVAVIAADAPFVPSLEAALHDSIAAARGPTESALRSRYAPLLI